MMNINTNYASSFAANAAKQTSRALDSSIEKLSSGSRINFARDDAAGQAVATRLSAESKSLSIASRNAADAQSMVDTAEGALQESHTVLLRMRELAVQSSNGTLQSADRSAIDAEFQQLEAEVNRIANNTKWAGTALLSGAAVTFQVGTGNTSNDRITVTLPTASGTNLGISTLAANTVKTAQAAITGIDSAIAKVSEMRGKLGAVSNRLSNTIANLDQVNVNLSASKGRIQDTDFASETSELARNQIMQQAATAMLAQANASKGTVLTLIQS